MVGSAELCVDGRIICRHWASIFLVSHDTVRLGAKIKTYIGHWADGDTWAVV